MGSYINKIFGVPAEQHEQAIEDAHRLYFFRKLQAVTNKVHATGDVQEIIVGLSADICDLFSCDRLTLYAVSESRTMIETLVKTGMNSFKDFSLPISDKSIAGYVALTRRMINIPDVYDESELKSYAPNCHFMQKVDKRTGYRTRELLTVPIANEHRELLGVLQLINNRNGGAFSKLEEEGALELCKTLAVAFAQRMRPPMEIKTKYDPLVTAGVLSTPELELARRSARRKGLDVESVLIDEFQVRIADVGASLAAFFNVAYEPFRADRPVPAASVSRFKRDYVEANDWLVLEESEAQLLVLTCDPDRLRASHIVADMYPGANIVYRVTTSREFRQAVDLFHGAPAAQLQGDAVAKATLADETESERAMLERVERIILEAFGHEAKDIQVSLDRAVQAARTEKLADGSVANISGHVLVNFRINYN